MLKLKLGNEVIVLGSTFSKITFNKGISKVKFTNPNKTAKTAKTAYLGTNLFNGRAKASILKYIFIDHAK